MSGAESVRDGPFRDKRARAGFDDMNIYARKLGAYTFQYNTASETLDSWFTGRV